MGSLRRCFPFVAVAALLVAPSVFLPAGEPEAPPALAVVDGQPLTLDDLDAPTREAIAGLDAALAQARKASLEEAIDERLFAIEARRRGVSADRLYFEEIVKRISPPSEAQIRAEFAARPNPQASDSLEARRDWLAGTLMDRAESVLASRWTAAARQRTRVVYKGDVAAGGVQPATTLATVGGEALRAESVSDRLEVKCEDARRRVYQLEREAVSKAVDARLLEAEARRRNVPAADLLLGEVAAAATPVSDGEVSSFFAANKAEIGGDLESSRAMIVEFLGEQKRLEAERAFYAKLRAGAVVRLSLPEPEPAAVAVPTQGSPALGGSHPAVTVVEFADFECPACGGMYPQLGEMLKGYGERLRVVYRHFPLSMHPHARRAAQAAAAARAQGKFWIYADRLFRNQRALDDASLNRYAAECGLELPRFEQARRSASAGAEVVHDIRDGRRYGVRWTPMFFVNGVRLFSYGPEALRQAIDAALAASPQSVPAAP